MGAERDCLFPGPGVIERAARIIPNCTTYLLRGRGHMHFLTDGEKEMIVEFLKNNSSLRKHRTTGDYTKTSHIESKEKHICPTSGPQR